MPQPSKAVTSTQGRSATGKVPGAGLHSISTTGFFDGAGNTFQRLCCGTSYSHDSSGLALGFVDSGLFFTFGAGNEGFALAGSDVDLLLSATFRGGNQGTFFAFGGDLCLHGPQDFVGRGQVFDFVAQHLHSPVQRGLVNGIDHLGIDHVALFKGFVQLQLADHAAQRGLRQLGDGHDVVARAIAGPHGVGDLKVQNAIHLQLGVVAGNTNLAGHIQWNFFQAVLVRNPIDKRNDEVHSRGQGAGVFAQPLPNPSVLLGHHFNRLGNEYDGYNQ